MNLGAVLKAAALFLLGWQDRALDLCSPRAEPCTLKIAGSSKWPDHSHLALAVQVPPEPETRFAEIQQELQDRKRQCREQAARIDHLEREVADMKLMVVKVYQLLEDSKHVADPTTAAKVRQQQASSGLK